MSIKYERKNEGVKLKRKKKSKIILNKKQNQKNENQI